NVNYFDTGGSKGLAKSGEESCKQYKNLELRKTFENMDAVAYMPVVRSGGWADIGSRHTMEDVFICSDNPHERVWS
ncbi:hypothetical protein EE612_035123, partial [Oryza sativa]